MHLSPMDERVEEMLELLWVLREDGNLDPAALAAAAPRSGEDRPGEVLAELEARRLVARRGAGLVITAGGEAAASAIVRRHRLAERLLSDVLVVDERTMAEDACRFEHVLSPAVTASICTLLGHPPTCPHGRAIPRGDCCGRDEVALRPLVTRLAEIGVGEQGVVRFVAGSAEGLDRLAALGLVPGVELRLVQRHPSHVLELGETTIAIDARLAGAIFVQRA
jgi:DtxR family Mn-dependent transcriptional regulator